MMIITILNNKNMKKQVMILLALLPALAGWAQDTIAEMHWGNYYYNHQPNPKLQLNIDYIPVTGDGNGIRAKEVTLGKEPITVYCVAAAMVTLIDAFYIDPNVHYGQTEEEMWAELYSNFQDTSLEHTFEYLGVYFRDADSLVVQREVLVHRKYDTPSYYVESGLQLNDNHNFCYPMYEKYFDSSIVVSESPFYVGVTGLSVDQWCTSQYVGFMLLELQGEGVRDFHEYHVWKQCRPEPCFWYWPPRLPMGEDYWLIFPILTPEPDTTGGAVSDTTVAVTEAALLSRHVSVQPNPAVEGATVLSSFGLTRIEAYDPNGHRVADLPASGLQATLDVASWPAATYLLRITTPMGTVTKKLIVR